MINYIKIRNYQSHKDTLINLTNGLNIITGASDSGKSVILRAFRWVLNNRPAGDEIRNWDAKNDDSVIVEISVDDILIGKERKKKKSIYYIVENGQKTVFEAVGSDVPEQIINALGLSDINIQSQHDKYFLLDSGMSAGEVAKKFNEMVGLDIIDKTFKNFASSVSSNKLELNKAENDIKSICLDLDKLSFVDNFKSLFESLQERMDEFEAKKTSIKNVSDILQNRKEILKEEDQLQSIVNFAATIDYLNNKQLQINETKKRYNKINQLVDNHNQIKEKMFLLKSLVDYEDHFFFMFDKANAVKLKKKDASFVSDRIDSLGNIYKISKETEESLKNNLSLLKKELEKLKTCPFCNSELTKEKINLVLKQL